MRFRLWFRSLTGRWAAAQQLMAPPVKQAAQAAGIAVVQPEKIRNNAEFRAQLGAIAPEAIVVVAYGRIIPPWMLALPRLGCINLHASLLPKYRGAAPIQWAVAMGDAYTGNTTMLLEEGLDTGPILLQQTVEIAPEQTAVDLFEVLAQRGRAAGCGDTGPACRWNRQAGAAEPQRSHVCAAAGPRGRAHGFYGSHRALSSTTAGADFSPGRARLRMLDGKKLIVHRMAVADLSNISVRGLARPGTDPYRKSSALRLMRRRDMA